MTPRAERMVETAPIYYQHSTVYQAIQNAIAKELDTVDSGNTGLEAQLDIFTATWGLRYWEEQLGIKTNEADSNQVRRSRVLGKMRGIGNFSAELVRNIAQAYSNEPVTIEIDPVNYLVTIIFIEDFPNTDDFKNQILNIIHAHLGTRYTAKVKSKTKVKIKHTLGTEIQIAERMNPWNRSKVIKLVANRFNGVSSFDGVALFNGKYPEGGRGLEGPIHTIKNRLNMAIPAPFTVHRTDVPTARFNGSYTFSAALNFEGVGTSDDIKAARQQTYTKIIGKIKTAVRPVNKAVAVINWKDPVPINDVNSFNGTLTFNGAVNFSRIFIEQPATMTIKRNGVVTEETGV